MCVCVCCQTAATGSQQKQLRAAAQYTTGEREGGGEAENALVYTNCPGEHTHNKDNSKVGAQSIYPTIYVFPSSQGVASGIILFVATF